MENNTTELIEFDKNVNYYAKVRKLNDFLIKAKSINSPEELYFFDTELKEYIFSDDVVKSLFLNKVENSRRILEEQKQQYNDEIQYNSELLIHYMRISNIEHVLMPGKFNMLYDKTNDFINFLDLYYYPSIQKCINNKSACDIITGKNQLMEDNEEYANIVFKNQFKIPVNCMIIFDDIRYKNTQSNFPFNTDIYKMYKTAYIEIIPILAEYIQKNYIQKYIPFSDLKKKKYAIEDIIEEIKKNPAINIKECASNLCKSEAVILSQVRAYCKTNNIKDDSTHSKGFKAFKKYIISKIHRKVL